MPHTPLKKMKSDITSEDYERNDVFQYSSSDEQNGEESGEESDVLTSDCISEYDGDGVISDNDVDMPDASKSLSSTSKRGSRVSYTSSSKRSHRRSSSHRSSCSSCGRTTPEYKSKYRRQSSSQSSRSGSSLKFRRSDSTDPEGKTKKDQAASEVEYIPEEGENNDENENIKGEIKVPVHNGFNQTESMEDVEAGISVEIHKNHFRTRGVKNKKAQTLKADLEKNIDLEADCNDSSNEMDGLVRQTKTIEAENCCTNHEDIEMKLLTSDNKDSIV